MFLPPPQSRWIEVPTPLFAETTAYQVVLQRSARTHRTLLKPTNCHMSTMQPIITVEGLSKVYRLGSGRDGSYRTLRESIMEGVTSSWNKVRRSFNAYPIRRETTGR